MDMKTLPERMKAYRQATGLSLERAAAQLGVSQQAWWHWEKGTRKPKWLYKTTLEKFLDDFEKP